MPSLKVIISGGGTGGHIFPAIAIANAIKAARPDTEFLFVGAEGKMEMEKVPAAGFEIIGLPVRGFQRKITLKNFNVLRLYFKSLRKARKIIKSFKPDVAIGVGGYASGPMIRAAAKRGVPTVLQEQNSYPGITNRFLAKKAHRICVAYEGMDRFFPADKIVLTGNPVRQEVVKLEGKRARGIEYFELDDSKKTLLVVGGSLGARTINESVGQSIDKWSEAGFQIIWQTGKLYHSNAQQALDKKDQAWVKVYDFIGKMDLAYAVADVVVSRAGAISVSELSLVKKPAILIPSPNVAEDHQTKNAMALVNHHAALLIKDEEARKKLGEAVKELMENDEQQEKLRKEIGKLGLSNAADAIAAEILDIAGRK